MKHTVTKLFLLLLLLTMGCAAKAQQWKELHTGVSEDLYDVCCIDTNKVFVCGRNGLILKTEDGGQTWDRKNSSTTSSLYLLKFASDRIGYACGNDVLLKTTDGGETWLELSGDTAMCFDYENVVFRAQTNLCLIDADTLYVADCINCLWKSTDGGESFEKVLDLQSTVHCFYKFDMYFEDNVGFLIGQGAGDFIYPYGLGAFKSHDYGKTWESMEFTEIESALSGVHFIDKDHIRIYGSFTSSVGDYYGILETTDGLESYSLSGTELWPNHPDPWIGESMAFSSENTGCYVYNVVTVKDQTDLCSYAILTQDNGNTWKQIPDGINWRNKLFAVDGVDTIFYIAANYGYIYKTGVADVVYPYGLEENENTIKVLMNPANGTILISIASFFDVENSTCFTFTLSTITGIVVSQKTCCSNYTILDTNRLTKGIYVLTISNGRQCFVKKINKY